MKKLYYFLLVLAIPVTIPLSQVVTSTAQETAALEVAAAAMCTDVVDREPVGAGDAFEVSLGKVYCFTTIVVPITQRRSHMYGILVISRGPE